ncbi:MAG: histidine phosphatase family protein [Candidatus Aenigmarchaeota archaeon]|nr:histidine phosphatase family protein [Candidatus Aenigmarchaeota archaeon]
MDQKLERLFVVQHGERDKDVDEWLSENGKKQMEKIGLAIGEVLELEPVHIISSTATRCRNSSIIISPYVNCDVGDIEFEPYLWPIQGAFDNDFERLYSMIKGLGRKNVIVVSHYEIASELPSYVMKEEFSLEEEVGWPGYGGCVYIDMKTGSFEALPKGRVLNMGDYPSDPGKSCA